MKTNNVRRKRTHQKGFTLLEILVVATILGIIVGIVGVAVIGQMEDAQIDATKVQLSEIEKSLDIFRVKVGKYPATAEGLHALVSPPKGKRAIMQKIPKDPWDNEFIYVSPGQHNQGKFDLQSKGPDKNADTEDDIKNW